MRFPTATYDEERSLNQGVYETKNEPIMTASVHVVPIVHPNANVVELSAQIKEQFMVTQTRFSNDFMIFCKTRDGKTRFWEIQKNAIDGKKCKKVQKNAIAHSPDPYYTPQFTTSISQGECDFQID